MTIGCEMNQISLRTLKIIQKDIFLEKKCITIVVTIVVTMMVTTIITMINLVTIVVPKARKRTTITLFHAIIYSKYVPLQNLVDRHFQQ